MTDVYQQDAERFRGITQSAKIQQRIEQDLALKAAIVLEREQLAQQQARQEALAREAALVAAADARAVEIYAALPDRYARREALARQVIEAIASLWGIEQEIRRGESDADREAASVEYLIEETQRGPRRTALRVRGGIPAGHIFIAPRGWLTNDGQRTGSAAVAALTSTPTPMIGPGWIQVGQESKNFGV